jgi:redox-regulated HSP33 family molecular chaperone
MQNMLQFLSGEAKPQITLQQRILFKCHCTEERAARALSLANKQEAVVPDGKTELRCEYCGKIYFL